MNSEHSDSTDSGFSVSKEEWDRRRLCSDGNCIGVIGPDGLCKECGKPYEGEAFPQTGEDRFTSPQSVQEDDQEEPGTADSELLSTGTEAAPSSTGTTEQAPDDDWARRVLCSDGNCIGVIGSDGRCKECGKPHEGS